MGLFLFKDIYSTELILFNVAGQPKLGKLLYMASPDLGLVENLEQPGHHRVLILIALEKVQD